MISVSEERAEDGERCCVGEDGTGGDGRGLHGWEICRRNQCLNALKNMDATVGGNAAVIAK